MTTPRSSASSATAGVGSTPPRMQSPPAEMTPRANASSSSTPEARVSRPTKTFAAPVQSAAARPRRSTSSGVRNSPTTPRTPSVPKYLPSHERRIYRLLNCGALRALCRPAFLRSTTRASRVRKPARFSGSAELGVDLDERTGDPVPHRAGLARGAAAVQANAEVVLTLEAGRLQRRGREHPVHHAREVLLDRLAVDPRRAVAGPQDHARNGRLALAGAEILGRGRHLHLERWSVPAPRADAPGRRRSSAWSIGRGRACCGEACP